ncbi:MAG: DUF4149 domain-containing protein [Luteitalea sp.]|nr:DUF4149 domain-containing protein [Luteitalea sp.]
MPTIQVLSVWLHILAAAVWIGGMVFLAVVLVPVLRKPELREHAAVLIHVTGIRFRYVGWVCLVVLIGTGIVNLTRWGIGWSELTSVDLWRSSFGHTLATKLVLVAFVLALSGVHDFVIGPRATAVLRDAPDSDRARHLRQMARWIGRLTLLLALAVVALAVMLARGTPW